MGGFLSPRRLKRAAFVVGIVASIAVLNVSSAQDFAAGHRRVFDYPQVNGVALDWCVTWGTNCGQAAADNFCRAQGYQRTIGFLTYTPGRTNVAGAICEGNTCGGFSRIECDGPTQASNQPNTGAGQTTLVCQFTAGSLAGQIIDYTGRAGAIPATVGEGCYDGATGSTGIAIAPASAIANSAAQASAANTLPPGMTTFCRFTQGPRAGETFDFSYTPGATLAQIGGACWDGVASSGVGVDPATAAAGNPFNPPATPAGTSAVSAQSGAGQTTLVCQFTAGSLAGQIVDYTGRAGAIPATVGEGCYDGATGSTGIAIASAASAVANPASQANAANAFAPGATRLCLYSQGPLAGQSRAFTDAPGAPPPEVGGTCWDGISSSGVVVAANSASGGNPFNPPATPAGGEASREAVTASDSGGQNGVFPFPQANGVAVDGCASWATDCGQPSADQFCRTQGFASASSWNWAYDQRTWVIGSNMYCDTGPGVNCGGLRDVVCTATGGQAAADGPAIMDRYAALANRLAGDARGRFYADSAVMLARYGQSIGWPNGHDPNAPPGDPNRGLDNWDAHYGHGANGGEIVTYVAQRLTALRTGLSPANYAQMETDLSSVIGNHGG